MNTQELNFGLPEFSVNKVISTSEELKAQGEAEMSNINWGKKLLNIPQVWHQTKGEGVKIAVLDTGVDATHPALKDAIADVKDFTGEGVEDGNGHGTHCAGIIAARPTMVGNSEHKIPFAGVAPKAELCIAKVLNNAGSGQIDWIISGIEWATKMKVDIISMSLGGRIHSTPLFKTIYTALAEGIIVICAAGNEGAVFQNSIGYPGRYGGVLTIASHDMSGNPSGFSSRGGEVDFMAPGENIWSTYKDQSYAQLSGTSMATPFVAGLGALIESRHHQDPGNDTPLKNTEDMKRHLMVMATHPGWHQNDTGYGPLRPGRLFGTQVF